MNLADLLREMHEASDEADSAPAPLPEAVVATLRELEARYRAGCPYVPGDLVSPRVDYAIKGAGFPAIVLEVRESPIQAFEGNHATSSFGARLDIRVATFSSGNYSAFWAESWQFEPFNPA